MAADTAIKPLMQRSSGAARLAFKRRGAATVLDRLYQAGSAKVRFPRAVGATKDAVLINTTGGIADGDRFSVEVVCAADTRALVTSQAAERVYRALDQTTPALIDTRLKVEAGAVLSWLPQETMLFDGGAVRRDLTLEVAKGGSAIVAESYVIGRTAMGETVASARLFDRWRVRYAGRLVYADNLKLEGDVAATLSHGAITGGATVFATLIYVGEDTGLRRDALRAVLMDVPAEAACSLRAPVLIARFVAADVIALHESLIRAAACLAPDPDHVTTRLSRQWLI